MNRPDGGTIHTPPGALSTLHNTFIWGRGRRRGASKRMAFSKEYQLSYKSPSSIPQLSRRRARWSGATLPSGPDRMAQGGYASARDTLSETAAGFCREQTAFQRGLVGSLSKR